MSKLKLLSSQLQSKFNHEFKHFPLFMLYIFSVFTSPNSTCILPQNNFPFSLQHKLLEELYCVIAIVFLIACCVARRRTCIYFIIATHCSNLQCHRTVYHPYSNLQCHRTVYHPYSNLQCHRTVYHPSSNLQCHRTVYHPSSNFSRKFRVEYAFSFRMSATLILVPSLPRLNNTQCWEKLRTATIWVTCCNGVTRQRTEKDSLCNSTLRLL